MICNCYSCQAGRAMKEAYLELKKKEKMIKAEDLLKKAAELKARKSKDYQGSMWSEADYFPYGDTSYLHMLWTKMLRIRSVVEQEKTNFESLEDSLDDMAIYAMMYKAWLLNNKEKENDNNKI